MRFLYDIKIPGCSDHVFDNTADSCDDNFMQETLYQIPYNNSDSPFQTLDLHHHSQREREDNHNCCMVEDRQLFTTSKQTVINSVPNLDHETKHSGQVNTLFKRRGSKDDFEKERNAMNSTTDPTFSENPLPGRNVEMPISSDVESSGEVPFQFPGQVNQEKIPPELIQEQKLEDSVSSSQPIPVHHSHPTDIDNSLNVALPYKSSSTEDNRVVGVNPPSNSPNPDSSLRPSTSVSPTGISNLREANSFTNLLRTSNEDLQTNKSGSSSENLSESSFMLKNARKT